MIIASISIFLKELIKDSTKWCQLDKPTNRAVTVIAAENEQVILRISNIDGAVKYEKLPNVIIVS